MAQLSSVKTRLALTITDYDGILTNAIKAISDRFDSRFEEIQKIQLLRPQLSQLTN